MGIIKAKGKYIISLDSDDYFINAELFFKCFKEAIENYTDIIEFSGFVSHFNKFNLYGLLPGIPMYFKYKTHNYYVRQPQLSKFIYQKLENYKYKLIDGYLAGKCIKTYILKKTIRIIGDKIYKQRMNFGDDRLINYVLFKIAKSFKFIKIFGYAYNYNNISITHVNNSYNNCHDELLNIANIYKFTKFTNDTELAAFEIFNRFEKIIKPGLNKNNSNYLNNLIKQMLNDKHISEFYKEKLIMNTVYNTIQNKTVIMVAHRLSTVKNCDKIFVFNSGKLVEEGNHTELLQKKGFYYQLWSAQNDGIEAVSA